MTLPTTSWGRPWTPPRTGRAPGDFVACTEALAAAVDAIEVRAESLPTASSVRLVVMARDPLVGLTPPWPLLDEVRRGEDVDLTRPVPVAVSETGELVRADLWQSSVLIGGQPSAGKSAALWLLALAAAADPSAILLVIDAKNGVELGALRRSGRAARFARDQQEAEPLLRELLSEVHSRYERLDQMGLRKAPPGHRDFPPLVLVIDELAEVSATGQRDQDRETERLLRRLVSIGRAAGLTVVSATQKPSADVISTGFRDLHRLRWAMRCGARGQAETILGSEALSRGASPEGIPPGRDYAGVGYLVRDDGVIARCRSFWVSDESIVQHLELCQRRHQQALRNGHSACYRETSDPPDTARNANPTATLPPPVQMSLPLEPTPLQTAPPATET